MVKITNNNKYVGGVIVNHSNALEIFFVNKDSSNLYNENDAGAIIYILNRFYGGNWIAVPEAIQAPTAKGE